MLLFNPITTQTMVCPSGERHDWGASPSMNFSEPPPIKVDATPIPHCPLLLKMNPALKMNLAFIEV